MTIPTLTTERLALRAFRAADFEDFCRMWANPHVVRFIGGQPVGREDSWTRFLRHVGMWEIMGFGFFAVIERASGRYVGEVGFQERLRALEPAIEGSLEAGWGFVPDAEGKGYATEAMAAALGWADEVHPLRRVTAIIDPAHEKSLRVAEKLGFSRVGEVEYHGGMVVVLER